MEIVYTPELIEYMRAKGRETLVVEVVSSDHSDFEVTELYSHIVPEKKAAEFLKKRFVSKSAPVGRLLLPPYRLHYADTVTFSLRSFLGIKSVRQEGITL